LEGEKSPPLSPGGDICSCNFEVKDKKRKKKKGELWEKKEEKGRIKGKSQLKDNANRD
jgi:hypothetical protein